MFQRLTLVLSGAVVLGSWLVFAVSYATSRPTEGGLGLYVIIGVTFTCFAGLLIVLAWTQGEGEQRAFVASVLAMLVILLLAELHATGWNA